MPAQKCFFSRSHGTNDPDSAAGIRQSTVVKWMPDVNFIEAMIIRIVVYYVMPYPKYLDIAYLGNTLISEISITARTSVI